MDFAHAVATWDRAVFEFVNTGLAHPVLDVAMPLITRCDAATIACVVAVALVISRRRREFAAAVAWALLAVVLSDRLSEYVKVIFQRDRPPLVYENVRLLVSLSKSHAFVSGHAANAFSAATVLAWIYRRSAAAVAGYMLLAVTIAVSRVYVGVHHPADVVVGALAGVLCGAAVVVVRERSRRGAAASGDTSALDYTGLAVLAMAALTMLRLWFILLPSNCLTPDEAQFWDWSRRLQASYYSKPPLIACVIRIFTEIGGSNAFSVRLGAVVVSLLLAMVTWRFVRRLGGTPRTGFLAVIVMNAMPLFSAGAVIMTPDVLLVAFWALGVVFYHRALLGGGGWAAWCMAGLAVGLGLLSKYTMAFLPVSILVYMIAARGQRVWLRRPHFYVSLAIAAACFAPVIWWNASRNWATFRHVASDAGVQRGLVFSPLSALEFLASQVGVIGPLLFPAMLVVAWRVLRGRVRDDGAVYLLCLALPVFVSYLVKSLQDKVQGNWAATAYYTWPILLVMQFDRVVGGAQASARRRWLALGAAAVLLSGGVSYLMYNPQILRKTRLDPKADPTAPLVGWSRFGVEVGRIRDGMPRPQKTFLVADRYQNTAEMAFYVPGQPRAYSVNIGRRLSQYDLWGGFEELAGHDAVYVAAKLRERPPSEVREAFERFDGPILVTCEHRKKVYRQFHVFRCYGFRGCFAVAEEDSQRY